MASLYEKYRPTSFKTFVGNDDLKRDLRPFIRGTRELPNAILFTGGSGMGKTTLARMLAKACKIDDLIELDIGTFTGIDTVRAIKKQAQTAPMFGNKRGWIIDECHALSTEGMNAFLKLLESPPKDVYFFLCTTDPQKLLKTVVTRCTQFVVSPLSVSELVEVMKNVCAGEQCEIPEENLRMVAKQANGSPRMALSLLERLIGRKPEDYANEVNTQELCEEKVSNLCQKLLTKAKWKDIVDILNGITEPPETVRWRVLAYMNAILRSGKDNAKAALIIDCFKEPYFNTKEAGLTLSCYSAMMQE